VSRCPSAHQVRRSQLGGVAAELARAQLAAGRPLRTRAAGHSMWPAVPDGAVVEVLPLPARLRVGDVVLVELRGALVLHRVIALDAHAVFTKGDAVPWADGPTSRPEVLGVLPRRPWDAALGCLSRRAGGALGRSLRRLRAWLQPADVSTPSP